MLYLRAPFPSLPSVVYLMILLGECVYIRQFGGISASRSVRCRSSSAERISFIVNFFLRDKWLLGTFPSIPRLSFCSQPTAALVVVVATAVAAAVTATATAIHQFRRHPSLGGPSIVNMALLSLLHPTTTISSSSLVVVVVYMPFCNTHTHTHIYTSSIDIPHYSHHSTETYMK